MSTTTPPWRRRRIPALPVAGWLGIGVVAFWIVVAIIGPSITPYPPTRVVDPDGVFGPMRWAFPLGTDYLGRDMLSRVLHGARYTVGVALAGALFALVVGSTLGLWAAIVGGRPAAFLSWILDVKHSLPGTIFALVAVASFGSSIPVLVVTIGLLYMSGTYRVARACGVNIMVQDYVDIARARGEGVGYLLLRETLPNVVPPLLADFGIRFIYIVLLLSGLGFLGLGIQPPNADLGSLVHENIAGLLFGAPAVFTPAIAIISLTLGVNVVIDNLPDRLRPSREP